MQSQQNRLGDDTALVTLGGKVATTGYSYTKLHYVTNYKLPLILLSVGSSLYIEFNELYWSIIELNLSTLFSTEPDLDAISCGGG